MSKTGRATPLPSSFTSECGGHAAAVENEGGGMGDRLKNQNATHVSGGSHELPPLSVRASAID